MGCADFYIEMRVADGVADLLKRTSGSKHGKTARERNESAGGKTCRDAHHVSFCDTTIDVTVRECLFENTGFGRTCQVSVQNDQIIMLFSQFNQCVAVALTGCDLLNVSHYAFTSSSIFSRSAIATAYSSSFGALPCQPT